MGKDEEEVQQEVKVEVEEPEKPVEILRAPTFKDPAMTASSQPKNPALKSCCSGKNPIRRRAPVESCCGRRHNTKTKENQKNKSEDR